MNGLRTWIEIDAGALRRNAAEFRKLVRRSLGESGRIGPKVKLMAVVKSNAYGHGLAQVAKFLSNDPRIVSNDSQIDGFDKNSILFEKDSRKSWWFGVDSIVEALALRREGIKSPILVLGYTLPSRYAQAAAQGITLTLSHFEGLRAMTRARRRPSFHLKLDTGMHRLGFQEWELPRLIKFLKSCGLVPQGIYSHLAEAAQRRFSERQISAFERCLGRFRAAGIDPGIRHLAKTEGIAFYPEARYDLVRLGIGLYGYLPGDRGRGVGIRLRPVMTWKTVVAEVHQIAAGERIGYGLTHRFRHPARIAVLPVGYWHGYDRGLSDVGEVLIRGRRAPVRGRVCMDMTMVEVTGIPGVRIGDEVVLIGRQGREAISADEIARKLNTISYEVLTRVNPLIRRVVV